VKKLLAAAAALAPFIALLPSAPASASTVCAPITIDGQQVCEDTTPVDQAVAEAQATVLAAADEALALVIAAEGTVRSLDPGVYDGIGRCDKVVREDDGVVVTYGTYSPSPAPGYAAACFGWELRIEASAGNGVTPVHVPQICLTITGTCVGGIDTTVPTPAPTYAVCLRSYSESFSYYDGRSLGRGYYNSGEPTDGACVPVV